MPPIMYPPVPRVSSVHPAAERRAVAVRDDMLSPAAVAERQKRLLREAQVAMQSEQSTDTEGG